MKQIVDYIKSLDRAVWHIGDIEMNSKSKKLNNIRNIPLIDELTELTEKAEVAIIGASLVKSCGVYAASRYCKNRGVSAESLIIAIGCSRKLKMLENEMISWKEYLNTNWIVDQIDY